MFCHDLPFVNKLNQFQNYSESNDATLMLLSERESDEGITQAWVSLFYFLILTRGYVHRF